MEQKKNIFNDYECDGQMTFNDFLFGNKNETFKIKTKIRLIELFGGVGSQAMALETLDPPMGFEHYRLVEFDKYPVKSYNAIHNKDFPTMDITKINGNDLGIVETDKYTYIMTYSFPCQDLSPAGKGRGMDRNSGTRSGLLWEVERLLNEVENLPQVLIMENVPQVHSIAKKKKKDENGNIVYDDNGNVIYEKSNYENFCEWLNFLKSKGYTNYYQDLNAREYGIAQNRNRCIMVSLLSDKKYTFPETIPLTNCMEDYLEDVVDEKYCITSEKAQKLVEKLIIDGKIVIGGVQGIDLCSQHAETEDICRCIKARYDAGITNFKHDNTGVCEVEPIKIGGGC